MHIAKKILLSVMVGIWCLSLAHAEEFVLPELWEAIVWMDDWSESQWYKLPVVRNYLEDAYYDDKYTTIQKQYIASLIRAVEDTSENSYRIAPWYVVSNNGTYAKLYGNIDSTIFAKTQTLINNNPNLDTIEIVYAPGSTDDVENHKAWRLIRNSGIKTKIKKHWFIASGGTDLLMSGFGREIHPESKIWVHARLSNTYPEPRNLPTTSPAHNEYVDYFTDMGISADLYRWTLDNTTPGTIHWLSSEELNTYWF